MSADGVARLLICIRSWVCDCWETEITTRVESSSAGSWSSYGEVRYLLAPQSVAVFGASEDVVKIGGRTVDLLKSVGYSGSIYPISLKYSTVQGLPAYRTLDEVGEPVDLAIIALPRDLVLDAVRACASYGVKAAAIFSAGFAEIGEIGARIQASIAEAARTSGMRVLGPNCAGAANRGRNVVATFGAPAAFPAPAAGYSGRVGLVSQSGAVGLYCATAARDRGLQFDPWITTGNECDVELADCLAYLAVDDDVSVIAAYMEGCKDGAKLEAALRLAYEHRKPVILLKSGSSDVGARAAESHTASIVGADAVFDAVYRAYNVCRVYSLEELINTAYACTVGSLPDGKRLGILSGSGGTGILMADAADGMGLDVAPLPSDAQEHLKSIWPAAGVTNPIDTTGQITNDPKLLSSFLDIVLRDGGFDAVVIFLTYLGLVEPWAQGIVDTLRAARAKHPSGALIVSMLASSDYQRDLERAGVPVFEDPTAAVAAASTLSRLGIGYSKGLRRRQPTGTHRDLITRADGPLNEAYAKRVLSDAGIPMAADVVVQSAQEAVAASARHDAVALKILSADIAHKSDVGGVRLNLNSASDVATAYDQIMKSVRTNCPEARTDGVLVTPMVGDGVETILGAVNDPVFGPVVMFGLGGVFVEVARNVSYRLAPFSEDEALEMVREIEGSTLLKGIRGRPPADVAAIVDALTKLSAFATEHAASIRSIDINPFIVRAEGQGAIAVDAYISWNT